MTVRTAEPKHQLQHSWWRQRAVKASIKLTRHACTHTRLLSCQVKRPLTSTELHFLCSLPPDSQNGNTKLTTTFIQLNYPHPPCQCHPPSFLTNGISSPVLTFPFRSPQNFVIYFNRQHKKRAEVSCYLPQMQNIFGKLEERTVCNVSGGLNASWHRQLWKASPIHVPCSADPHTVFGVDFGRFL